MDWAVIVAILLGMVALWVALLVMFWALRPKGVSVKELVRIIPDVLRLLRSLIGDRSAPLDVRVVLIGLVAWIISPFDLIPEFIPALGPLDDVVVAIVAMRCDSVPELLGRASLEHRQRRHDDDRHDQEDDADR